MAKICTYCGSSRNMQDDHIRAQTKGGLSTTPACAKCNQSKGDKPLMEWLRSRAKITIGGYGLLLTTMVKKIPLL